MNEKYFEIKIGTVAQQDGTNPQLITKEIAKQINAKCDNDGDNLTAGHFQFDEVSQNGFLYFPKAEGNFNFTIWNESPQVRDKLLGCINSILLQADRVPSHLSLKDQIAFYKAKAEKITEGNITAEEVIRAKEFYTKILPAVLKKTLPNKPPVVPPPVVPVKPATPEETAKPRVPIYDNGY